MMTQVETIFASFAFIVIIALYLLAKYGNQINRR